MIVQLEHLSRTFIPGSCALIVNPLILRQLCNVQQQFPRLLEAPLSRIDANSLFKLLQSQG